jgi:ankyrin repeat protein
MSIYPLWHAISKNYCHGYETLDLLVRAKDININNKHCGITPILYACSFNNVHALKSLLSHPDINITENQVIQHTYVNFTTNCTGNVFHVACYNGFTDILMVLLDYIKDRKIEINFFNSDEVHILTMACKKEFKSIVKALLSYEGPVELIDLDILSSEIEDSRDQEIKDMLVEYREKKYKLLGKRKIEHNLNNNN